MKGIYQIRNIIDNKVYIGSSIYIERRWIVHKRFLENNVHHCLHLQRAWNKYGKKNFIFEIIELVLLTEDLKLREQYWFESKKSYLDIFGYNMGIFADCPARGRKLSKIVKDKLSKLLKGRIPWNKNKILSEKHKKKISLSSKGKKWTQEHRKNMEGKYGNRKGFASWNKGKKGLQVPWNKGLTRKTDIRVNKYIESRMINLHAA